VFLNRWRTDVDPIHQRTERTREFRTQYAQLGLKLLATLHGGAIVAVPVIAHVVGIPMKTAIADLLLSEALFLGGLALVLLGVMFSYITLDVDVIRHKAERVAARIQVVQAEFPDECSEAMTSELNGAKADQVKFWGYGVALSWTVASICLLSWLCLIGGGIAAGAVLATMGV
jgi:hypothetical protein